jgi:hypothetical protein
MKQFNLDTLYERFENQLARGKCYTRNGFLSLCFFSEKEEKIYEKNKPYREYLNSVRDSLKRYLDDTLAKLFNKLGPVECHYEPFYLKFSTKNELIKVATNKKVNDADDRKELKECKAKIEEAFKHVHENFVKAKKPYTLNLSFDSENKPSTIN